MDLRTANQSQINATYKDTIVKFRENTKIDDDNCEMLQKMRLKFETVSKARGFSPRKILC